MSADVVEFPAKAPAATAPTDPAPNADVITNLTQALELQGQSIKIMIDVITRLEHRVKQLELAERKRQRSHALYNAAGDKIGG